MKQTPLKDLMSLSIEEPGFDSREESEWNLIQLDRLQKGEIVSINHHALSFRIGRVRNKRGKWVDAYYTPDFFCVTAEGRQEIHEIKGSLIREAAMVRFKAAAEKYPMYDWQMWQLKRRSWNRIY